MRAWIAQHARALAVTLAQLARAPLASLLNIGVIGIALALPAGLYAGLANLQRFAGDIAAAPQLTLFLRLDAGRGDSAKVEALLRKHPGVRAFSFVPRDKALRELKAASGLADVVDGLDRNPLPDAFVVDAADGAPPALEALRAEFARWPAVEHVQLDSAWAQRLRAILDLGRLGALMLGTLLAFALVATTFNTIRLQIMTRREEIEVARLIGATDPFIRRPFLYHGAALGLAGGLVAWAVIGLGIHLLGDGVAELARLYGAGFALQPLPAADGASMLAFSAWLGWGGAWLSVNRHLSRLDPH